MAFTFFFRDIETLDQIREHVLPKVRSHNPIKIWDAGCATGAEPYTIALILKENMGPMVYRNVRIVASDIDNSNLFGEMIRTGSYPREHLHSVPKEIFKNYFTPDENKPGNFVIAEEVRRRIEYRRHDLLTLKPVGDNFDVVVCKNVLLHFTEEERINVIKMYYNALRKDGYFITEYSQELPDEVSDLFERIVPKMQLFRKMEQ